jgi:hypothetical protein
VATVAERRNALLLLQVSADDRRHLCERTKLSPDVGLSAYGSVVYQLKDANIEASGTCDFVCRALRIVYKTGKLIVAHLVNGTLNFIAAFKITSPLSIS